MGVDHYENFPVASVLCPPALRPAVVALYHFARTADDLADEGCANQAERLAELADYRGQLERCLAQGHPPEGRWVSVFGPLSEVHRKHDFPLPLLRDLLSAFEQDACNAPHVDRASLLDYCRRSAHPIGRLLLHLYGIHGEAELRRSDAVCTALQLINFWQDLGIDQKRGRDYLPAQDRRAHGLPMPGEAPLQDCEALRTLLRQLCDWAEDTMHDGRGLAFSIPGRAGWELRLVIQGGLRILEKIRQLDYATMLMRPTLLARDAPLLLWRALRMPPVEGS